MFLFGGQWSIYIFSLADDTFDDEFADIRGVFLIKSVNFQASSEGLTTERGIVVKDAYNLQAEQNLREARTSPAGEKFFTKPGGT